MNPMGIVFGVIAGVVGAAIWAGISYTTGYELGLVAWGLGALVGFAVMMGSGGTQSTALGLIAVGITVVAILAAKYATVKLLVNDHMTPASIAADFDNEELLISYVADDVAAEYTEEGRTLNWPETASDIPETKNDYPSNVWAEATRRWDAMSPEDRQEFKEGQIAATQAMVSEYSDVVTQDAFWHSFGALDIVFFLLAAVTAFQLGNGTSENNQPANG